MSSTFGKNLKISVFGESHGPAIGVVIDGLPPGQHINLSDVLLHLSRRAPGNDITATPRKESDIPEILSGLLNGTTTGAPLTAIIKNTNTKSVDYNNLKSNPRPGHADYTAAIKYKSFNDIRGGGHFSGRLTACMVFAGSICRQILKNYGIDIAAHIYSISSIYDQPLNPLHVDSSLISRLNKSNFPLVDTNKEPIMRNEILSAKQDGDSVGGIIECLAQGIPPGIGSPMFDSVESKLSSIMFAIPAVKAIEFGLGFESSRIRGSQNNDQFFYDSGSVKTKSNNCGGILGGLSSGMPIIFRVAVKPTPSISLPQDSVNLNDRSNTKLQIKGRHDPCIVPRAVPVVESACAVALLDLIRSDNFGT